MTFSSKVMNLYNITDVSKVLLFKVKNIQRNDNQDSSYISHKIYVNGTLIMGSISDEVYKIRFKK